MNIPTRILLLSAWLLTGAWTACLGGIIVHWLDDPMFVGDYEEWVDRQYIDVDGNGTIDFIFSCAWSISFSFRSEGNNRYLIHADPPPNIGGPVAALEEGFRIGQESEGGNLVWFGDDYDYWSSLMWQLNTGRGGEFWGTRAYIGFEFQIDDNIHYGWFDIQGNSSMPYGMIYGWGYESTPGVGIAAGAVAIPEPATATLLAIGTILLFSNIFSARKVGSSKGVGFIH